MSICIFASTMMAERHVPGHPTDLEPAALLNLEEFEDVGGPAGSQLTSGFPGHGAEGDIRLQPNRHLAFHFTNF